MQASASKFSEEESAYMNQVKKKKQKKTCELKQAARYAHTKSKIPNYSETYIRV